jgi:hypothetical protein
MDPKLRRGMRGMGTGHEITPKNNQLQTYFSMNDFTGGAGKWQGKLV